MRLREIHETKFALAGDVDIHIITDLPDNDVKSVFAKIWLEVFTFERSFSRFLPMSELSKFNRQAGLTNFVTPEFKRLLETAKNFGAKTSGLYNPFILPALQRAGYIKSAAINYENDEQEDYSKRQVVAIEKLIIGEDWARIPYGTALDLGGCGKGYLADVLSKILDDLSPIGYWLSLSGDIRTKGVDENGLPIYLNIQDAVYPEKFIDWIIKCPETSIGVATSGTFRRKNQSSNRPWHHLIDPQTLMPAKTDVRLATIIADDTTTADVLASCAVILGSQKAPVFLKKHGVKSALLQCIDKEGAVFVKKFGSHIKNARTSKELQHA